MKMNYSVKSTLKSLGRNYGVHVRYMPRLRWLFFPADAAR
jgi:hypothetical protein